MERQTRRGRKPKQGASLDLMVHVRVWEQEHPDLFHWFNALPPRRRAFAVLAALEAGGMQSAPASDFTADAQNDLHAMTADMFA